MDKKKENSGKKKMGKFKKIMLVMFGCLVFLFVIGSFGEDDTEGQQSENLPILETDTGKTEDFVQNKNDEKIDETISETEIVTSNTNEVLEYIYSIEEYDFEEKKRGKMIIDLYENALEAKEDEFIYIAEEKESHLFSDSETWYKKTIDENHAGYRYYGEIDKEGKPNGVGMLVRNWNESGRYDMPVWTTMYEDGYCVELVYIGEFKDGYKEGYGLEFDEAGTYDMPVLKYVGEFVHGRKEGEGIEYLRVFIGDTYDGTYDDRLLENHYAEYSESANTGLLFPKLVKTQIWYEGEFKEDKFDGKGTEYWNVSCVKYEGNFKNGSYSGKGTLYDIDGNLCYEGEFKSGKYNGKGILYDEQGKIKHKGNFKDGDIE